MNYASNEPYIIIGQDNNYTDNINYIKSTNPDFITEIESFGSSNNDKVEDIIKEILNIPDLSPEKLIEYYHNNQILLLSVQRLFLMSINENMFLEPYMKAYNNGEKIVIIYKNNPIKSDINNYSILAIVMFKDKRSFDNIDKFSLYIKGCIDKSYEIHKRRKNKDENTKLIFSKLFNLDRVSAEKEMSHSLGMEPFDKSHTGTC